MDRKDLNIAGRLGAAAMGTSMTPIISILIFLIGLVALVLTPREENPVIDVPAANVIVRMQGASPEEVQNLIVRPLEMVLGEMTGVDHTYGTAMDSMGVVTVMFKVGEDKEASLVKLYDRMMHNLDRIPPGASQPLIKPLDVDDVPVSVITLSTPAMDGLALKRLAERVREQLIPLKGVSVADIVGGRDREVRIDLDPARMTAYGITLDQLHQVLAAANSGGPVGDLVGENHVTKVWLDGYLKSAQDVGRLIVGEADGKAVYLRDIASVVDGPAEVEQYHRIGFGAADKKGFGEEERPAVSIALAKKRGTNAVFVTERINKKLESLKGDLIPDNVQVTITRDSGNLANAAVNMLIEHLGIAIVSVIIIMLLFLGWREAAIVTMNIPLILFIVLAIGLLADQTINRITLFALILSLGLLVDDAIVVIENIHRHLHHGAKSLQDKAELIIRATNETGKPTIIATIAVILAFIPMAFVTGMMGPYMAPIPFNAPIAMAASLVIAYMFTPWIAQRWLPCRMVEPTMEEEDEKTTDWVHRTYMKLATPLIEKRGIRSLFWLIVLLLFAFSMWEPAWQFVRPAGINGPLTAGTVELKMLPKGNKNTFNITIDMPEGTTLEETDGVTRQIADIVRVNPMVTDYEAYVGQAGPIDFNGMLRGALFRNSPYQAELRVNLVDKQERSIHSDQIVLQLRKALAPIIAAHPRASIKLVEDPPGPPVRATLLGEIYGPDYATQRAIAAQVKKRFAATYDVTDIDDSVGEAQTQLTIVVDKEKASRLGVATRQVELALKDFLGGYNAGAIHVDASRHPVMLHVQLPKKLRATSDDLSRIYVSGKSGPVQLSSIATVRKTTARLPIFSKDSHPVVYVTAEPKIGSQVYPLLDMDSHIDGSQIAPGERLKTGGMHFTDAVPDDTFGYQMLWDGEMRLTLDVFRDLGAAFIVGLILIYLLMVAYYGEFILPMLVMAPTALTLIGIFPGHWITGQPFTATSMIGMIALAGIVVRNSLLLIDFILDYRRQGYDVKTAVLEAGAVRARPILLTALAVIAGTSIMISDPVFGGLGVSMAFGTLAATVLTLFIIPLIYYLWQRNTPWPSDDGAQCNTI
ncbi:efflux RND transporter permease subunit [Mariprofundus ferrooxydans]|uniref:Acriflavin resistance protein n=1 Tax=Mariprofundus ferrooxydans PV-1 TaxID=314345 RepID=Q0EXQ1_9PROT|nr:efflux RND transporter permease subunit [Mariprofundus ferrooxydans]EAU53996.1 Acriflavin resistance protein [Mariprofundus ferrooxydans PV-1]KON47983.1 transporter [Mariprofundus ferrooxydans]